MIPHFPANRMMVVAFIAGLAGCGGTPSQPCSSEGCALGCKLSNVWVYTLEGKEKQALEFDEDGEVQPATKRLNDRGTNLQCVKSGKQAASGSTYKWSYRVYDGVKNLECPTANWTIGEVNSEKEMGYLDTFVFTACSCK